MKSSDSALLNFVLNSMTEIDTQDVPGKEFYCVQWMHHNGRNQHVIAYGSSKREVAENLMNKKVVSCDD